MLMHINGLIPTPPSQEVKKTKVKVKKVNGQKLTNGVDYI